MFKARRMGGSIKSKKMEGKKKYADNAEETSIYIAEYKEVWLLLFITFLLSKSIPDLTVRNSMFLRAYSRMRNQFQSKLYKTKDWLANVTALAQYS
jgi:hypothetical protein